MEAVIIRLLIEDLAYTIAHQRIMTHLEIERIVRETNEPIEDVTSRVQALADRTLEQIKSDLLKRYVP